MTSRDLISKHSYWIDHEDGDFGSYHGAAVYLGPLKGSPGDSRYVFDCGDYGLRIFDIGAIKSLSLDF